MTTREREVDRATNIETRLPQEPASVAEARGALEPIEPHLDADTLGTLRLLVSELVTNSVRHGQAERAGEIELSVSVSEETVRVEIADPGPGFEVSPRAEAQDQGSGWGLHFVEVLSDRWGTERDESMRVWFELTAEGAPA